MRNEGTKAEEHNHSPAWKTPKQARRYETDTTLQQAIPLLFLLNESFLVLSFHESKGAYRTIPDEPMYTIVLVTQGIVASESTPMAVLNPHVRDSTSHAIGF